MPDPHPGRYRIISCLGPTGIPVREPPPDDVVVRLNQRYDIWRIAYHPRDNTGRQLSIEEFPFTGVNVCQPGSEVIATVHEAKDQIWYFVQRAEPGPPCPPGIYYSIHPGCNRHLAWTVKDVTDPMSPIVINPFEEGNRAQLFRLERVSD